MKPDRAGRAGWSHLLVEMIEDCRALDQHFAVVEHQRWHSAQRIVGRDLVGIAEGRPRPMLERQTVEPQCNSDAADKWESNWPMRIMIAPCPGRSAARRSSRRGA